MIDILVQRYRSARAAKRFFRKLLEGQERPLSALVTDKPRPRSKPQAGRAFSEIGTAGLSCGGRCAVILAPLPNEHEGLREVNDASGRTGDPLNPMDPTAEVGTSNFVRNRGFSGIRMLNLASAFAGFHTSA